ncbi:MAG: hypothetical protein AB7Y46_15365 [Armatimonadota bacterium]
MQVHGQIPEYQYGVGWIATCGWSTELEKNAQVEWRVKLALDEVGAEPPNPLDLTLYDDWTPDNTVVKATGDALILHHAEDTSHEIAWNITHYTGGPINPTFTVTVSIYDLSGNLVETLVKQDVAVGADSINWHEDLPQQDGVYTYSIEAEHSDDPAPVYPCADHDKSGVLTVTNVSVQNVDFRSRYLTLACDVHYTLSRQAGYAKLIVYGPDLTTPKYEDATISLSAGQQQVHVEFRVGADKMGTYQFVVYAEENAQDGTQNRDGEPKPAVQGGATAAILPRALDMYGRTSMNLGGPEAAATAREEQEHPPQGNQYPPPPYDATLTGLEVAAAFWRLSSVDEEEEPNPEADAIFWYMGHADAGVLYTDQLTMGTQHMLFSGDGTNDEGNDIFYMGNMPDGSLNRCALVMLLGCSTAVDPDGVGGDLSILQAFMDKGAACGIGSFSAIYPPYIRLLSNWFWIYTCRDGESIADAFAAAMTTSQTPAAWFTDPVTEELMPVGAGSSKALRPASYR